VPSIIISKFPLSIINIKGGEAIIGRITKILDLKETLLRIKPVAIAKININP
jgi:hypothetical protein